MTEYPYLKAPASTLTYAVDWSARYPNDSITACNVTGIGVVCVGYEAVGLAVAFTVTGGTDNMPASAVVVANFASGQTDQFTVEFAIQET